MKSEPDFSNIPTGQRRINWIETLIEVEDPHKGIYVPMVLNPMQRDIVLTMSNREISLKSRRAGLTSIYVADSWLDIIFVPGTKVELMAHNQETADEIFDQVVRVQYERIPKEFQPVATTDTVRSFRFHELGSSFKVLTAGQSEDVAKKKGQSRVITNLILTEYAFYSHPEAVFSKITNCVPAGKGKIYIDSTPNGQGPFYIRYKYARQNPETAPYKARFYPWWWDPRNAIPVDGRDMTPTELEIEDLAANVEEYGNPKEGEKIESLGLTAEQLMFRRNKIESLLPQGSLTSRDVFIVEYPENDQSCFLHSGRPVFLHQDLVTKCKPRKAIKGHRHSIGHDASTGDASGHPAGTSVIDITTGEQVYEWMGWKPLDVQVEDLILLQKQYPGVIVPERNYPGDTILTLLKMRKVKNIYHHVNRELKDHATVKPWKRKPGFPTSGLTKPQMFSELEHSIRNGELLLCGKKTIDDLKGYQYNEKDDIEFMGSAEQKSDGEQSHGDLGIATCLAWWGRKTGTVGAG